VKLTVLGMAPIWVPHSDTQYMQAGTSATKLTMHWLWICKLSGKVLHMQKKLVSNLIPVNCINGLNMECH
jgi:hypothetical protein